MPSDRGTSLPDGGEGVGDGSHDELDRMAETLAGARRLPTVLDLALADESLLDGKPSVS